MKQPAAKTIAKRPARSATKRAPVKRQGRIGEKAVLAKTGQGWDAWFRLLDAAGASQLSHAEIARWLHDKQGLSGWWSQMVANSFEQARGLRAKGQSPDGYKVSASKTLAAPLARVYACWKSPARRRPWLGPAELEIATARAKKSLRIVWDGGPTRVDVNFYEKNANKIQVVVQHRRLPNASQASQMQAWWKKALLRLSQHIHA